MNAGMRMMPLVKQEPGIPSNQNGVVPVKSLKSETLAKESLLDKMLEETKLTTSGFLHQLLQKMKLSFQFQFEVLDEIDTM